MRVRIVAATAACGFLLAACGSDPAVESGAPAEASAPSNPGAAPAGTGAALVALAYAPTTDVAQHGAVGQDMAAIRALLKPTEANAKPDFAAAKEIWSKGKFSTKGDGTKRTLAGFVAEHPVGTAVADAFAGTGSASDLTDAQRIEWVDKGMTVALAVKIMDELAAAKEKLAAGEVNPTSGATHNVDEAWAFFNAEGNGVISTAVKRSKDYALGDHALGNDGIAAMQAAQNAVGQKDAAALEQAIAKVRGATNRIFALAVKKYAAAGETDAKARAEGMAFSWALVDQMPEADLKTIQEAFGKEAVAGAGKTVADALDAAADELGITSGLPAYVPAS